MIDEEESAAYDWEGREKAASDQMRQNTDALAAGVRVSNPLALIDKMIERGTDPAALKQMMDMCERWQQNQAASAFAEAITGFQDDCAAVIKSRSAAWEDKGTGEKKEAYKFASFDDVMRVAGPVMTKYGIVVTFTTSEPADAKPGMKGTCRVRVGTHVEETTLFLPIPQMKVNDTQKFGAALAYLKRYLVCAALGIVTTDKDDDAAGQFDSLNSEQIQAINKAIDGIIDAEGKATAKGKVLDSPFIFARFLEWLLPGAKNLEDIPASKFDSAIDALDRKRKAVAAK